MGDSYYQEHKEISIHALREEGDLIRFADGEITTLFLSTPSARRATAVRFFGFFGQPIFLSTPSARRATRLAVLFVHPKEISIHALREEGDDDVNTQVGNIAISIHALREEGD